MIPGLAATAVLALAALLFVLRPLSVFLPGIGADASWMTVLGEAATRPARWGVDLAFTYGPASALVTRYFTDRYLAVVPPIMAFEALAWAFCLVRLVACGLRGRAGLPRVLAAGALIVIAALPSQLIEDTDAFVFAFALGVFLLDVARDPDDRASLAAVALGAAALGIEGLAKSSYGILALLLFALADVNAVTILRRRPVLVPVMLAAFLAAFVGYGQRLTDLPAYLRLQSDVVAGYGPAMYIEPLRREIAAFLLGVAALGGVAAWSAERRRLVVALGLAAYGLIALKAGFVRADSHPQISWGMLGLGGLPVAAVLLRRSLGAAAALAMASLAVLLVVQPLFLLVEQGTRPDLAGLLDIADTSLDGLGMEAGAWARFARDPSAFAAETERAKREAWAAVRSSSPLPALAGTVDMVPSAQSALLAAGLDYVPRPSVQSYATYTATLIAANRAYDDGPQAPDWVLFGPEVTDDRFPNMLEGALWPVLFRRYEVALTAEPYVALHRRPMPLPDVLGAPRTREIRLGDGLDVPAGPVFVAVSVRPNLLGRLAGLVFRPPPLHLRLTTATGGTLLYRFIPAIGAEGFLLSPIVENSAAFARLARGEPPAPSDPVVRDMAVTGSAFARLFYDADITVSLRPLAVPPAGATAINAAASSRTSAPP